MRASIRSLAIGVALAACSSPSPAAPPSSAPPSSEAPPPSAAAAPPPSSVAPQASAPEPAAIEDVPAPTPPPGPGGFGISYGHGAAPRATGVVRTGEATVSGGLSREIVRRVVLRHINEVRYCYEHELATTPSLAGRVTVHFTIDGSGETRAPSIASSVMTADGVEGGGEPAGHVETCLVATVDRWTFPAEEGGATETEYPFVFSNEPPAPLGTEPETGEGTIDVGDLGRGGS